MSLSVSKDCFPAAWKCHNCERKFTERVRKERKPRENYQRCSKCHVMTYCDKDCQREHWLRVHKMHCRFLSGKTPVANSKHDAATCPQCAQDRETSLSVINSVNSPKTRCNVVFIERLMKKALNNIFGFHGQGKKCNCSQEFGLHLPYALGEVSGQYLEIASTGIDAMLAHVLKILSAMILKARNEEQNKSLRGLLRCIISERALLWKDILVNGKPQLIECNLYEQIDNLEAIYGASNPWCKILNFSVAFFINLSNSNSNNFYDSQSLEDPRFQKVQQMQNYYKSQLQNERSVCQNKMWPKFMVWPQLVRGSLKFNLPPGTNCQSCYTELSGEVTVSPEVFDTKPILMPGVGDSGALLAFCSPVQNQNCFDNYLSKKPDSQMAEYIREKDHFQIESRECDFCLKMSLSSHRCSGCLTVQYCSTTCQKEDLGFHQSVCATWAKDEYRLILGKAKQKKHWKSEFEKVKK